MKRVLFVVLLALLLSNYAVQAQPTSEFRAAWIATVDNIDWPSRGNYNTESQKAEYIRMLDMHQRNGLNAVVVQVRPAADAFYPSQYEPWSQWLTGKQGTPPSPFYDPLEFMIEEAHKRGMEFHAWCNPYRAEFSIGKVPIAPTHVTKLHPEWFVTYGTTRYFDPGNREAQEFVVKVVRDIVSRYNVDAIHFDDYFYPYRLPGKEFPDWSSYNKYGKGLTKDEWRRANVDSIIVKLSRAIKDENPQVKFGISPFGVWRNADKDPMGSATRAGVTNYDDLYADILLWLREGWIDYVAPQLYWEFGQKAAPYEVLIDWWSKHTYGRHCYVGLGIYRAGSNAAWRDKTQLPRQIRELRQYPTVQGAIYFSSKSFQSNPFGWNDSLRTNYYKQPARIPDMPWLDSLLPARPTVQAVAVINNGLLIQVKKSDFDTRPIKGFRIYACYIDGPNNNFYNSALVTTLFQGDSVSFHAPLPPDKKFARFYLTTLDEQNKESKPYTNWPLSLDAIKDDQFGWIMK
ncbi:family 10 glycosylhydrolase [Pseudoflavitalea sp. G-6-1-2]|uniref:glycoside hydrolase family 10 protein n=1 Tax=Pseudoflavitalea sp. G-6-1-2 TaxID=2728841 RepID=UPI00146D6EAF|nr:family 10 glycosylhydrolase [Pseudoflavitalea sp. G-6-1-2]NML19903.1 family 10 glycosylhydrolase [Pseudoflavitalea sp. G-6-1-2]